MLLSQRVVCDTKKLTFIKWISTSSFVLNLLAR